MFDSHDELYVSLQECHDRARLTLAGTLDEYNVDVLIDALGSIRSAGQAGVVIDIGKLDALAPCGMNAIVLSAARFARRRWPLSIVGANPLVWGSSVGSVFSSFFVWPGDDAPPSSTLHAA